MHLFGEPDKQEPPATDLPSQLARKLYQALHKSKVLYRRVNLKSWAQCFKSMIDHGHYDQELVEVMDWYISNMGENRHLVKVTSAFDFAEKFAKIRFFKDMDTIAVSAVAELIINTLPSFVLPKGLDKQLPFVTECSVQNARKFIEAVKKVKAATKSETVQRTINHLYDIGCLNIRTLVSTWLVSRIGAVEHWEEWNGEVSTLILDINSKAFNVMGRHYIYEWCGASGRWDELMELVRKEISNDQA